MCSLFFSGFTWFSYVVPLPFSFINFWSFVLFARACSMIFNGVS